MGGEWRRGEKVGCLGLPLDVARAAETEIGGAAVGGVAGSRVCAVAVTVAGMAQVAAAPHDAPLAGLHRLHHRPGGL